MRSIIAVVSLYKRNMGRLLGVFPDWFGIDPVQGSLIIGGFVLIGLGVWCQMKAALAIDRSHPSGTTQFIFNFTTNLTSSVTRQENTSAPNPAASDNNVGTGYNSDKLAKKKMKLNFDNRIFMESHCGVALASLGQIVEGYAVAFGTESQINLKCLKVEERQDFLQFVFSVRRRVENHFGSAVLFEHGACSKGTNVSCGVDRMHVHIVPFDGEFLVEEMQKQYECLAITATIDQMFGKMSIWENNRPYFWIENGNQVFLFSYGEKRESQVVRRAIANQVGMSHMWNWREFPTQAVAERVAQRLSADVSRPERLQTVLA